MEEAESVVTTRERSLATEKRGGIVQVTRFDATQRSAPHKTDAPGGPFSVNDTERRLGAADPNPLPRIVIIVLEATGPTFGTTAVITGIIITVALYVNTPLIVCPSALVPTIAYGPNNIFHKNK